MRLKLIAVLVCLLAGVGVVLLSTQAVYAQDDPKKESSKTEDSAKEEAPPKRYVVPEGGVEELVRFINGLREFQPDNLLEFTEYQKYGPAAVRKAAEKILKLETDKTSQAWQTAYELTMMFRLQDLKDLSAEQKHTLVDELKQHLAAKGKNLGPTDIRLGVSAARELEYSGENKLGSEIYEQLGKTVAALNDERYDEVVKICEGSARRLSLVGEPIKIVGTRLDGKKFNINSLKGKVVLVDFWATWCGPCREEVPNVKEQYEKYKDRGFEVVGISIDENRTAVDEYVADEHVPWIMLHDTTEAKSDPTADYYGIMTIPCMILVGRDGKVISLQARGEVLNRLLAEQFEKVDASKVKSEPAP